MQKMLRIMLYIYLPTGVNFEKQINPGLKPQAHYVSRKL